MASFLTGQMLHFGGIEDLQMLAENLAITQKVLAEKLGKSERTIKFKLQHYRRNNISAEE